jgi:quercetin dioxygenase-like cupin family protein
MPSRPIHQRARDLAAGLIICIAVLSASNPANAEVPLAADAAHGRRHPDMPDLGELPGTMTPSLESRVILRGKNGLGQETLIHRTVRAPGTRAPIHFHDAGGATCVIEGEMTLYLPDAEPRRAVAGDCYYMPPGVPMSGVNSGTVDAVLLDIFTVPEGTPVWRVIEEGFDGQNQFSTSPE